MPDTQPMIQYPYVITAEQNAAWDNDRARYAERLLYEQGLPRQAIAVAGAIRNPERRARALAIIRAKEAETCTPS